MKENQTDTNQESSKKTLDLSTLSEFDFGPSWMDGSKAKVSPKESWDQKPRSRQNKSRGKRDPHGLSGKGYKKFDDNGKTHSGAGSMGNREGRRHWNQSQHEKFQPTVMVNIYPQDDVFDALVRRLRTTARTYQLFEIANLILEKPDRYLVVVQNKAKKDETPKPLYYTVSGHLPFETEDAAVNYALNNHLNLFFDIEVIELEPPKGNFQMVNRCTVTGELLGPPNYHRYQEFLQRHYASKINNMSFEQFVSKVEPVKEQESIDAWVESMKKGFRYTLKERMEGEPEFFESFESVRYFLLQHRKDAIIGKAETVRFNGRDIEHLPKGAIRHSIEIYIEHQLNFPLDTANNIRGRLRRHNFTVYKKGSKGIAYVCAVRRKFRDSTTIFTSSIQNLIEFIEKNPNIPASQLPKLYLGIDVVKQNPEKLEMDESEKTGNREGVSDETEEDINEGQAAQTTEETKSVPSDTVFDQTGVTLKSEHSKEDLKRLDQLILDLRWLVTEGYVTEYGDGNLFAPPPMPDSKPKDFKSQNAVEAEASISPEKDVGEKPESVPESDKEQNENANNQPQITEGL
jgi:hypothetical protein